MKRIVLVLITLFVADLPAATSVKDLFRNAPKNIKSAFDNNCNLKPGHVRMSRRKCKADIGLIGAAGAVVVVMIVALGTVYMARKEIMKDWGKDYSLLESAKDIVKHPLDAIGGAIRVRTGKVGGDKLVNRNHQEHLIRNIKTDLANLLNKNGTLNMESVNDFAGRFAKLTSLQTGKDIDVESIKPKLRQFLNDTGLRGPNDTLDLDRINKKMAEWARDEHAKTKTDPVDVAKDVNSDYAEQGLGDGRISGGVDVGPTVRERLIEKLNKKLEEVGYEHSEGFADQVIRQMDSKGVKGINFGKDTDPYHLTMDGDDPMIESGRDDRFPDFVDGM